MDTAVLALRTVLALVVVVGLVVVLGRVLDDRAAGRTQGGIVSRLLSPVKAMLPGGPTAPRRRRQAAVLTVVGRQALGPKASVAVVDVGDQRLVLGVSEAGVTLLTSMQAPEPETEPAAEPEPAVETVPAAEPVPEREDEAAGFDEVFAGIVAQGSGSPVAEGPRLEKTAVQATAATAATVEVTAPQPKTALQPTSAAGKTTAGTVGKTTAASAVAGSVLSPDTWRQAVAAVQSRNRR